MKEKYASGPHEWPTIKSTQDFAEQLHISHDFLVKVARYNHHYYRELEIPKASGGTRRLHVPDVRLKAIQRWILVNILSKLSKSNHATAYSKGCSTSKHAKLHATNKFFVLVDLKDFFPSLTRHRVKGLFLSIGYNNEVSSMLAGLCTIRNWLPQGAVTSPSLSNILLKRLDARIAGLAHHRSVTYSRYADDICLSSSRPSNVASMVKYLMLIIKSERVTPNAQKTRYAGPRRQCRVTGLVRNTQSNKFGVGRQKKRQMRAVIYRIAHGIPTTGSINSTESLQGWLSYLRGTDYDSYAQMSAYWLRLRQKLEEQQLS